MATDIDVLFKEIVIETPVDKIIKQLRNLISSGQLKAGDKLPSERKLSTKFGVSRNYVRDAIQKLEFYGILKTMPQSGTVVAGIGITALEGLISDILKIENSDFASLVETRVILETETTKLAAIRRTDEDIVAIKDTLTEYEKIVKEGKTSVEQDLMFHLKIAEASKNSVLKSLMLIITPDIIKSFNKHDVCKDGRSYDSLEEHKIILEYIINQNAEAAANSMKNHLQEVLEYSNNLK
ncbi:MAG: FadR/GntR family transcriptional regulator [Saprospiraceae bacterium]